MRILNASVRSSLSPEFEFGNAGDSQVPCILIMLSLGYIKHAIQRN